MANGDHSSDFSRIASKETNSQKGQQATPARRLAGSPAPASNPMKNGGINRAKSKSSLQ